MNKRREELEKLIAKMELRERSGLEITDDEIIKMIILASQPMALDEPVLRMTKEQMEEADRQDYARKFSRVVPCEYDAWNFMEHCLLPDLKGIIDKIQQVVGDCGLSNLEKKKCYKEQEECLVAWISLFDDLCQKIINAAEICNDENAELAADFLITGNLEEMEKHVVAWTSAVHLFDNNGVFDLDNYYSVGFMDFYQYFYDLLSYTVKRRSEDEIFYYHVSWLILLLALHTDFLLNHRL